MFNPIEFVRLRDCYQTYRKMRESLKISTGSPRI